MQRSKQVAWRSVGLSIYIRSRHINKLKAVCMSDTAEPTLSMFCCLHPLLKLLHCDSHSLSHYANQKTHCCCCLFPQLRLLLFWHNVYIAPFSITFTLSICYSNSFPAFNLRSLLFWLCTNMTVPLWIETHDKVDVFFLLFHLRAMTGAQQESRSQCQNIIKADRNLHELHWWYINLVLWFSTCSRAGSQTPASVYVSHPCMSSWIPSFISCDIAFGFLQPDSSSSTKTPRRDVKEKFSPLWKVKCLCIQCVSAFTYDVLRLCLDAEKHSSDTINAVWQLALKKLKEHICSPFTLMMIVVSNTLITTYPFMLKQHQMCHFDTPVFYSQFLSLFLVFTP